MNFEISNRKIVLFLVAGYAMAIVASLCISIWLAQQVTSQTRDRELALMFGAIEAGPLAIARLQSSAIAQNQLTFLMSNSELENRGFVSASIQGGPDLNFRYAGWQSGRALPQSCEDIAVRHFEYADAIHPFEVKITRDLCLSVSEKKLVLFYSAFASLVIAFITMAMLVAGVWPVALSLRRAELAFTGDRFDGGRIYFQPIRKLVRAAIRSAELEREQMLTTLAQQVAHDIRSPLSALNTAVSILARSVSEDKLSIIKLAIHRINDLADGLILQRQKTSGLDRDVTDVLVYDLILRILEEKRTEFSMRTDIKIESDVDEIRGIPLTIKETQFSRVLSNLINNSVDALPQGGYIRVRARLTKKSVEIELKDNGLGMPEVVRKKLGLQAVTYGKSNGSGQGFLQAYRFIEETRGKIKVYSALHQGTEIRLIFPRTA